MNFTEEPFAWLSTASDDAVTPLAEKIVLACLRKLNAGARAGRPYAKELTDMISRGFVEAPEHMVRMRRIYALLEIDKAMITPEHSPLPWTNEPDAGRSPGAIRDADGCPVQIYGRHGEELRARIVSAVNSPAGLLDAATAVVVMAESGMFLPNGAVMARLKAAIAKAEKEQ